jgi:hypothetical protein
MLFGRQCLCFFHFWTCWNNGKECWFKLIKLNTNLQLPLNIKLSLVTSVNHGYIFRLKLAINRSQWPLSLRRGSIAVRLLGLRVRIAAGEWMSALVSVVCMCCQVEFSAMGRSLVETSTTHCGVSQCDLETTATKRPRPNMAVEPWKKKATTKSMPDNLIPYVYI